MSSESAPSLCTVSSIHDLLLAMSKISYRSDVLKVDIHLLLYNVSSVHDLLLVGSKIPYRSHVLQNLNIDRSIIDCF